MTQADSTQVHPIAELLTDEQKRRIVAAEWYPVDERGVPRERETDRCPLEVAFDLPPRSTEKIYSDEYFGLKAVTDSAPRHFMDLVDTGLINPDNILDVLGIEK